MGTTITSDELDLGADDALAATDTGIVIITDGGRPTHVLLSFEDYQKLSRAAPSHPDALAMPGGEDIDFDLPRMGNNISRPVDFD